MARILIFLASLLPLSLFAISAEEEALILNQELEFLESAAKNLEISTATTAAPVEATTPAGERSLEDTYFGEADRDEVNVRRAAPKRRSF